MYKVSVSTLDRYLRLVNGEIDMEEFVDGYPPNERMEFGSYVHKMIAEGKTKGNFRDKPVVIDGTKKDMMYIGWENEFYEVPVSRKFDDVILNGRLDFTNGSIGVDFKVSRFSDWMDYEKYYSSIQWQSYIVLGGLLSFQYCLMNFEETEDALRLAKCDYLVFNPYPGIEEYVSNVIYECKRFSEEIHRKSGKYPKGFKETDIGSDQ